MSADATPDVSAACQEYAKIWADATSRVLEQLCGSPINAMLQTPPTDAAVTAEGGESIWIRFQASGALAGEQAFQFSKSDGVRMAQLLMSETADGNAELDEARADALNEVFRQFAGVAATSCKTKYEGEVRFELQPSKAPEWKAAGPISWTFAAQKISPIQWTIVLNPEMSAALETKAAGAKRDAVSSLAETAKAGPPSGNAAEAPRLPANLDLLLDVELEASLRFGQRDMPLRDILELRPGSVVELDRRIEEPAELLVAGRIIARGEVVIVDGSYGLRITDIAQHRQRLESVKT
jgi:flagellar motor switch protein FliN/FliY